MIKIIAVFFVSLVGILRDRVLHALIGVSLLLLGLAPALGLFSMRQVQELAMTVTLSAMSLSLLVLSIMLGGFSVWKDVEKRYTASALGLPISRSAFLLGKFSSIVLVLVICAFLLGSVSFVVVKFASTFYPPDRPMEILNFIVAVSASVLKFTLLAAFAMLLSSLSTSFFLPIFGTLSVFIAGSATQEVMEYVSGPSGQTLPIVLKPVIQGLYYLLPNFSAFDFTFHAIYGIPLPVRGIVLMCCYFGLYTTVLLSLACYCFGRREL